MTSQRGLSGIHVLRKKMTRPSAEPMRNPKPPADVGIEAGGIQKDDRSGRSQRAADPKRAVDGKVGPATIARRDHFLNRGVHRAVFTAYASPGQHPEQTEAFQIPAKSGSGRGY